MVASVEGERDLLGLDKGISRFAPSWVDDAPRRMYQTFRRVSSDAGLPLPFVVARRAALILAGLCLWFLVFGLLFSGIEESRAQHTLYAKFRQELAQQTAPLGDSLIAPGSPIALIDVPRAGVHHTVVVEGTSAGELRSGPGHRRDTPLPGQPGASQIFGKSTTFGGPFGNISKLRPGDSISVVTQQGKFAYTVERIRRGGDPVSALSAGSSRLTLVSSAGSGWRSGWAPSTTIYVDATLQGKPQTATNFRPSYIASNEAPMHGDTGGLETLVLWLEALVVVTFVVVWAARRWARVPAWMLGGVCIAGLLWIVTDVASELLPNLI